MLTTTENIYQQKVNLVIDYISAHLHHSLKLDAIVGEINMSQRQMLRIMKTALNEPLHTYIVRQRMERAVMYMQTEEMSLTTLSEMVGYNNPQSFSKAFKNLYGISPKAYMKDLHLRLESMVRDNGNRQELPLEIVEEEALELVYIRIIGHYGEEEPYAKAWGKLIQFIKSNKAITDDTRFIGISFDDPNITQPNQCRFYACASVKGKINPTGEFGTMRLKGGKYAVYTLKGSYSGLQEFYNCISVSFDYNLRHGIAFEEYLNSLYNTKEEDLVTKIYIPVK